MVPPYVKSLLPMFCRSYQSTMIQAVKKASLLLIKKSIFYTNVELLKEVVSENKQLVSDIVEVLTAVLDHEEDDDGHLNCLLIIKDLVTKDQDGLFQEQFSKLGLRSKVRFFYLFS